MSERRQKFVAGDTVLLRGKVKFVNEGQGTSMVEPEGSDGGSVAVWTSTLIRDRPIISVGDNVKWDGSAVSYRVLAIDEHKMAWIKCNGQFKTARLHDLTRVEDDAG